MSFFTTLPEPTVNRSYSVRLSYDGSDVSLSRVLVEHRTYNGIAAAAADALYFSLLPTGPLPINEQLVVRKQVNNDGSATITWERTQFLEFS